jgi:hypothetical protein
VKQSVGSVTVVDENGVRDEKVLMVEIPGELLDVEEVASADGGFSLVGYDSAHRRITITPKPYLPRARSKPDAGDARRPLDELGVNGVSGAAEPSAR